MEQPATVLPACHLLNGCKTLKLKGIEMTVSLLKDLKSSPGKGQTNTA